MTLGSISDPATFWLVFNHRKVHERLGWKLVKGQWAVQGAGYGRWNKTRCRAHRTLPVAGKQFVPLAVFAVLDQAIVAPPPIILV